MVSKVRVFRENLKQPRLSDIFLNEVETHEVVEARFANMI